MRAFHHLQFGNRKILIETQNSDRSIRFCREAEWGNFNCSSELFPFHYQLRQSTTHSPCHAINRNVDDLMKTLSDGNKTRKVFTLSETKPLQLLRTRGKHWLWGGETNWLKACGCRVRVIVKFNSLSIQQRANGLCSKSWEREGIMKVSLFKLQKQWAGSDWAKWNQLKFT